MNISKTGGSIWVLFFNPSVQLDHHHHELGHFTLAKLNGIRVDEFSLGMGPTLFGWEFKGTKFQFKAPSL